MEVSYLRELVFDAEVHYVSSRYLLDRKTSDDTFTYLKGWKES